MLDLLPRLLFSKHAIDQLGARSGEAGLSYQSPIKILTESACETDRACDRQRPTAPFSAAIDQCCERSLREILAAFAVAARHILRPGKTVRRHSVICFFCSGLNP
jgi:hypothetical protein